MWYQLFKSLLLFIKKLLNKKGDCKVFTLVKAGENYRVDRVLREILRIPVKTDVFICTQPDLTLLMNYVGEFERRHVGDTCRMILKFQHFDKEPLKYYAWEGIVQDDGAGFGLGIYRIWPEEDFGIITGRGVLKTVLIEKCRK
jgi:hypothetical protein